MTRKDYEALAEAEALAQADALAEALLRSHDLVLDFIGDERNENQLRELAIARNQLSCAIGEIGRVLLGDNSSFDFNRFYHRAMPSEFAAERRLVARRELQESFDEIRGGR